MSRDRPPGRAESLLLVAVGGFAGANLRYVFGLSIHGMGGTFAANVLGCLFLGFLAYGTAYAGVFDERTGLLFGTGFLSSFTTYSAFAIETTRSPTALALAYVGGSYGVGFAAVLLGRAAAARLPASDGDGSGSAGRTDTATIGGADAGRSSDPTNDADEGDR